MVLSYPDVIGEYMQAPIRFSVDGLQYAGYFEHDTVARGQVVNLFVFLQNTLDVGLTVTIQVKLPKSGGFFSSATALEAEQEQIEVELDRIEVGLLTLPLKVTDQAKDRDYPLTLEIKAKPEGRGQRVRPQKSKSRLGQGLIDNPIGLNLVGALGATYQEKAVKQGEFNLTVVGDSQEADTTPLKHSYQAIYTHTDGKYYNRAVQEIELRRIKLEKELSTELLYVSLFGTSTVKFADAGLPLRVGEAIILAKTLTYTCQYFLSHAERYSGLMLPVWERAYEADYDTTDAIDVISKVGYYHLLKLAGAVSFGTLAKTTGKQLWALEERQGVVDYIADNIETGQNLEPDFLYLPLLMAGVPLSKKMILEGEDVGQSLALLQQASQTRIGLFEEKEMEKVGKLFDSLLNKQLNGG